MNVTLHLVAYEDKSTLRNMLELYLYDFSEYDNAELNEHGLYGYEYLDHYWKEAGRYPFFVRADGKLAGFVLVSRHAYLPGNEQSISEFFILRKYRRHGVGSAAACAIFDRFPGKWEVQQEQNNEPSHHFWRKVIGDYTHGNYQETTLNDERWKGPVQWFDNVGRTGSSPVTG
jgi:predicted acetyltransferase